MTWSAALEAAYRRAHGVDCTENPEREEALLAAKRLSGGSMGSKARLALASVLARAGAPVSLVTIHGWSRAQQGSAYLWAIAFLAGAEDTPPPLHVPWRAR